MSGNFEAAGWGVAGSILAYFLARMKLKTSGRGVAVCPDGRREPYDG